MIKKLAIRTVTAFSWHLSQERLAKSLHRFSQVEADSAWQLLHALEHANDSSYGAKLFKNALEEVEHAELFGRLARNYSDFPLSLSTSRRHAIYDKEKGVADFEAYLFLGEAEVYQQFLSYASAAPDNKLRETFMAIRRDEEGHQSTAYDEVQRFIEKGASRRLIRRNRLKRIYEAWLRVGQTMGDSIFWIVLNAIYFVTSPTLGRLCKSRINSQVASKY